MPAVELRELIHYPFLPEAQKILASRGISVDSLSKTPSGVQYLDKACTRVICAIDGKTLYPEDTDDAVSDIITYVLGRILVSCINDRMTIQRFVRAEAKRAYTYLTSEQNETLKQRVCVEFGISLDAKKLSVIQYVEMASYLDRDAKWKLINRELSGGFVKISPDELEILLSEKIRFYLGSTLPLKVPVLLARDLQPWTDRISAKVQERTLEEFGAIDESSYPPCIQALIEASAAGANVVHSGRFALVAFLRRIGMPQEQIETIFSRAPGYNADMTEYQVNHILSHEYESMSCATMQTHGVCSHKTKFCESINHPLNYYRKMKKLAERKQQAEERREAAKKRAERDTAAADAVGGAGTSAGAAPEDK